MSSPLRIKEATMLDVWTVLHDLREEDRREAEAFSFHSTDMLFENICALSTEILAIYQGDRSVAIYGVSPAPEMEGAARIWLLQREGFKAPRKAYLRIAREAIEALGRPYDLLFNWKWIGNEHHLRWLERLGFVTLRAVKLQGQIFYEFVRPT
jgi:hypothetical protein